jgi:hypothetical protein
VPAFAESTIHIVTGLLLPIWKRLPNDAPRVVRLQLDTGEHRRPPCVAVMGGECGHVPARDAPDLSPRRKLLALCYAKGHTVQSDLDRWTATAPVKR